MYQAIPYSAGGVQWPRRAAAPIMASEAAGIGRRVDAADQQERPQSAEARGGGDDEAAAVMMRRAVAESPVVVVGRRGCCLTHVVKRLLQGLGVNPAVHEVADEAGAADDGVAQLPAVFVGGRLLGGLDRLMAVHISGELVPILKDAGALWL